jgi:hypothetical protein
MPNAKWQLHRSGQVPQPGAGCESECRHSAFRIGHLAFGIWHLAFE